MSVSFREGLYVFSPVGTSFICGFLNIDQDAKCSNRRDEIRIREAIAGFEQEVEIAIEILMKAGAYDDSCSAHHPANLVSSIFF